MCYGGHQAKFLPFPMLVVQRGVKGMDSSLPPSRGSLPPEAAPAAVTSCNSYNPSRNI